MHLCGKSPGRRMSTGVCALIIKTICPPVSLNHLNRTDAPTIRVYQGADLIPRRLEGAYTPYPKTLLAYEFATLSLSPRNNQIVDAQNRSIVGSSKQLRRLRRGPCLIPT